jgi:hypothetical protein
MFKKSLLVLSLCVFSLNAGAWSVPKLGGDEKPSGNIEADVTDFSAKSAALAKVANESLVSINSAFDTEEIIAAKKAELSKIDAMTDPKEKGAATAKLNESESAQAAKNLKSADAEQKVKSLTAVKQKKMSAALLNFGIAALNAPALISKGKDILSGASLTNAMKVLPVKDALPLIGRFVSDGGSTIAGFIKIAKGANIAIPEATATGSYVKADDI